MFEAAILVCLASLPDFCVELMDNRGPYPTNQQCIERVAEMIQDTKKFGPEYFTATYKYNCEKTDMLGT
jgi:hypothetical protein